MQRAEIKIQRTPYLPFLRAISPDLTDAKEHPLKSIRKGLTKVPQYSRELTKRGVVFRKEAPITTGIRTAIHDTMTNKLMLGLIVVYETGRRVVGQEHLPSTYQLAQKALANPLFAILGTDTNTGQGHDTGIPHSLNQSNGKNPEGDITLEEAEETRDFHADELDRDDYN